MISRRVVLAGLFPVVRAPLAPVTAEALAFIKAYAPKLVEIGAGDGAWARALRDVGVRVAAFDLYQPGPGVQRGSHEGAARYGSRPMLAIWPPDGGEVQRWIRAAEWPMVLLCAQSLRVDLGSSLQGYAAVDAMKMTPGREGGSTLTVWKRKS